MKIIVTGSSGFIGFHLTQKLLYEGHKVLGIDNHSDFYDIKLKKHRQKLLKHKNFKFLNTDINNLKNLEGYDLAINLAAQPGVRVEDKRKILYQTTNINGFEHFCDQCLKSNIKKIIYASSSSVYSDEIGKKYSESTTSLEPKSAYGLSKLANENFAEKFSDQNSIAMVGLRFFSVYGPLGRPDMAYYKFTERLLKNQIITLNNNGDMSRDMTYIDDIVNGIYSSISFISRSNGKMHEIFNLGNDCPIKTKTLLAILEEKLEITSKLKLEYTYQESAFTHADINKAKKLLGYKPSVDIDTGINNFINWLKKYEKR